MLFGSFLQTFCDIVCKMAMKFLLVFVNFYVTVSDAHKQTKSSNSKRNIGIGQKAIVRWCIDRPRYVD
jgi:hypothetical protein